jgi:hypothetical protein
MPTLPTERTRLHRLPERGRHDRATIEAILDAGFVCHVGFVAAGQPYVIPTGYVRAGDRLYIHGSAASRMVRGLAEGISVCVTVTLVDALVLARSSFHHSVNYRSVVVLGRAHLVTDAAEKMKALRAFTNHVVAGRFEEARRPSDQELKGTSVLSLGLEEASAKIRTGPPNDDEEDLALDIWAGIVPLTTRPATPLPAAGVSGDFDVRRVLAWAEVAEETGAEVAEGTGAEVAEGTGFNTE